MCPHGFDPMVKNAEEKKIRFQIVRQPTPEPISGLLLLHFHSHTVQFELEAQPATGEACTQVFKRFQNFHEVVRSRRRVLSVDLSISIDLLSY